MGRCREALRRETRLSSFYDRHTGEQGAPSRAGGPADDHCGTCGTRGGELLRPRYVVVSSCILPLRIFFPSLKDMPHVHSTKPGEGDDGVGPGRTLHSSGPGGRGPPPPPFPFFSKKGKELHHLHPLHPAVGSSAALRWA